MCIFTNIAFSLKTEMFGLNDTTVRKLILDDILQVLKSQVQKYPVTVNFHSLFQIAFRAHTKGYPVWYEHLSDRWLSTLEIGAV